ncbi:MAG: MarR family transcriptional regulator [Candidatus Bathyarchaeota archaeon]|nr:MarR family transcriptional regulator [Candidatus Bathyarchaeota archaeon]MDH5686955.1 MarR family transcriptional regulator [Candidatus Bathyarchaeota archaeon]
MPVTLEIDDLKPLMGYFEILIEEYPNPISQTELSVKSSVTKSAVSKIVDRLKPSCSMRMLAFERKLVLKLDAETFGRLLWLFFSEMRFQRFLRSNYTRYFIEKMDMHEKLTGMKEFEYDKYFNKEETDLIIEIILRNICSYQIDEDTQKRFSSMLKVDKEGSTLQVLPFVHILNDIVSNFDLGVFDNEDELLRVILLRDKFYAFIRSIARRLISEWEVVKRVQDAQRKKIYFEAYIAAIDHFLVSQLSKVTESIRKSTEEKKIPFNKSYEVVGKLWPVQE